MKPGGMIGLFAAALVQLSAAQIASAAVVISGGTTKNMTCSGGVCSPTAVNAVLNATELENMLAAGNTTVTTTGLQKEAQDIRVKAALSWTSESMLSLDANRAIEVDKRISVAGPGGLNIMTDGALGNFYFGPKGSVNFLGTSNPLTINGQSYMLVSDIASLASSVAANPNGNFALVNNYDARQDGTYTSTPIQTNFFGSLQGLGNSIAHLSIRHKGNDRIGFFSDLAGIIENLSLTRVSVTVVRKSDLVGGLVGSNAGRLVHDHVTGTVRSKVDNTMAGGLAGYNSGLISLSSANVDVEGARNNRIGALVGMNVGTIHQSYSLGTVAAGDSSRLGGLVGENELNAFDSLVDDSYATVSVIGGIAAQVGGFVGDHDKGNGAIHTSYSTGAVSGGDTSVVGGFAGTMHRNSNIAECYWDTTTSGTTQAVGEGDSSGITGLTDEQLKSGLPEGFDPAVWAQDPSINSGYPYLIANPPRT
jgi:hypothetical protein